MLETNSLYQELNTTVIDIFNERLQERFRRRKIVKDYGLVAFNKHQLWIKSMEVVTLLFSIFISSFSFYEILIINIMYIKLNFRLHWVQK